MLLLWILLLGLRRRLLGQHDIHIVTRPDQARDTRRRVNVDAEGTGIRCQDAGEKTPFSWAQYVFCCDGTASVEEVANQRSAKSDLGVGRIKDRPCWNTIGRRRRAYFEIVIAGQCPSRERVCRDKVPDSETPPAPSP